MYVGYLLIEEVQMTADGIVHKFIARSENDWLFGNNCFVTSVIDS